MGGCDDFDAPAIVKSCFQQISKGAHFTAAKKNLISGNETNKIWAFSKGDLPPTKIVPKDI